MWSVPGRRALSVHRDCSRTSGDDVTLHRNSLKLAVAGAIAVGALFASAAASAGTSWSIGVNVPGIVVGTPAPVYYEPAPAYTPPAPVYYQPPPPVRYRPAPVYEPAPVYYEPGRRWDGEARFEERREERREWRRREWERREHYRRYHEDRD